MSTRESVTVYSLSARYLAMRRMIDAGYTDVHAALQDDTMPGWSWRATWIVSGVAPASIEAAPSSPTADVPYEQLPSSYMRCPDCGAGVRGDACDYCGAAPVDTRTAPSSPARCEYCGAVGELAPGSIYCGPCELARRPENTSTPEMLAMGAWNDRQLASSPELVTCPDCHVTNLMVDGAPVAPVNDCRCPEYVETRRGTIALAELAPASWIWSTGFTQGTSGSRAYAITDAYITLVRASSPAPEWTF